MRRRVILLSALVAFLSTACLSDGSEDGDDDEDDEPTAAQTQELAIRNPVKTGCADPSVMRDGGTYYLTCTGGDGAGNLFPIYVSTNLLDWRRQGEVFRRGAIPTWANDNWWAPELHHVPAGGYVAVFSAKNRATGKHAIGVAKAASPTGPYADRGEPLASSAANSAIDAHVFTAPNNKLFLYYKGERANPDGSGADIIRAMPLSDNGMNATGAAETILKLSEGWEGASVEAPWIVKRGDFYYLFYSGNLYCNASYAVGVARSRNPMGPFVKKGAPILKSGSRWVGPGHNAVTRGTDGKLWMVYHAYNQRTEGVPRCGDGPSPDNNKRHTLVDRIAWSNGWPRVVSNL